MNWRRSFCCEGSCGKIRKSAQHLLAEEVILRGGRWQGGCEDGLDAISCYEYGEGLVFHKKLLSVSRKCTVDKVRGSAGDMLIGKIWLDDIIECLLRKAQIKVMRSCLVVETYLLFIVRRDDGD